MHGNLAFLYRNITRIQQVGNQLNQVPSCKETHCRRTALVSAGWLQSFYIYKLVSKYFQTFASLSESYCSQSESGCDCLEADCLLLGDCAFIFLLKVGTAAVYIFCVFFVNVPLLHPLSMLSLTCWKPEGDLKEGSHLLKWRLHSQGISFLLVSIKIFGFFFLRCFRKFCLVRLLQCR